MDGMELNCEVGGGDFVSLTEDRLFTILKKVFVTAKSYGKYQSFKVAKIESSFVMPRGQGLVKEGCIHTCQKN